MTEIREPATLTPFDAGKAIALTFILSTVASPWIGSSILGALGGSLVFPVMCAVLVWRKRLSFRESFSLSPLRLRDLGIPIAVYLSIKNAEIGIMAGLDIVSRGALSRWGNLYPTAGEGRSFLANMLMAAVVAPITEELTFRGFALNSFRPWNYGWGVIIPSVIFASLHHPVGVPGAFVGGIAFAIIALKYRSVAASIVVHGVANAYLVILNGAMEVQSEPAQNLIGVLIGLITLALAIGRRQWFKSFWLDFQSLWRQFKEPDKFWLRLKSLFKHWSYIVIVIFMLLTTAAIAAAPYMEWGQP